MDAKRVKLLFTGWISTVRDVLWVALLIPLAFVGMHLLGQGTVQELDYTLLLIAFGLGYAGIRSFYRYVRHQLGLWDALAHLPPNATDIPAGHTASEQSYRTLSIAYQQAQYAASERATTQENERLDYFTLWVHQIKTPISALDLMAQSDEPIDRELLRQEVLKIGQYADAALSFQRLQSMHNDLALSDVRLYPLCCAVVKKLRPIFLYRNIRLHMEPFEGTALSDPKWLGMALTQVVTNALKYTPTGGEITIAVTQPLSLTIRDTGVGIRPEDLPRVFDRGFTGHVGRTGSEGEKSTGIGLYLCKQACDHLGHTITLASPPEGGVTATFHLQRASFEVFS